MRFEGVVLGGEYQYGSNYEKYILKRWMNARKMKRRCGVSYLFIFIATQKATPSEMAGAQALKLYALSNSIKRKCLKSSTPTSGIVEIVGCGNK